MATEELLERSLAARLAFSKLLHARLGAESCAYVLSADVVEAILKYVYVYLGPVVVPHTGFAGAHTNNPQYFEYTDNALRLITVCWLSVSVSAERVPAGHYAVVLDLTAGWQYHKHTLHTTVQTRQYPTAAGEETAWEDCCPAYEWDPARKGRGKLRICEVELCHASDIRVVQQQLGGNWKGGTQWHRLILEPQPKSKAPCEASWWPVLPETETVEEDQSLSEDY